jgi:hypothetical protein
MASLPTGTIRAPPRPWSILASTSSRRERAMAQARDPTVKRTMARPKTRLIPYRSASQPLMGMKRAEVRR